MPYRQNLARCSKCGNGYITGDCIDLLGKCVECERQEKAQEAKVVEVDLTHLVSPCMREKLKQEIQTIMNDALAGVVDIYRYEQDGRSYIRWGRVQRHIFEAVDSHWPKED